ncbi:MAG: hypothetical protein SFU27_11220 [Thermonemataceae bacterium]|nr:hypothetical protein [Thermonemataceae bacterium]
MKISVAKIQTWCNDNVSPVAWQRVVLKVLPELKGQSYELSDLLNPSQDLSLDDSSLELFGKAIFELYQTEMTPEFVFA